MKPHIWRSPSPHPVFFPPSPQLASPRTRELATNSAARQLFRSPAPNDQRSIPQNLNNNQPSVHLREQVEDLKRQVGHLESKLLMVSDLDNKQNERIAVLER